MTPEQAKAERAWIDSNFRAAVKNAETLRDVQIQGLGMQCPHEWVNRPWGDTCDICDKAKGMPPIDYTTATP